jgi:predicted nuclease of predicted toxin-antitoxin system
VARLYANENFPLPVVQALRSLGHDVLTVREAGYDNQRVSDEEVVALAVADDRAIITINRRDFIRLHRRQPDHRGIIACTEDADSEGQARRIDQAITTSGDLAGALIRVYRPAR